MRWPKPPPSAEQVARKELRSRVAVAFRALRKLGLTATMEHRHSRGYKNQDVSVRPHRDGLYLDFIMDPKDADNPEVHKVPAKFLHTTIRVTLESHGVEVEWDGSPGYSMKLTLPAANRQAA